MFRAIRRDARTIIIAVVAASLTAGAPAIAHGVHAAFAHDADKVDGKHAVGSGASLSKAKGKLVATASNGKLPAKFIPKVAAATTADNAGMLDGRHANGLVRVAMTGTSNPLTLTTADQTHGPALSITAPAAGFVLVTSSVNINESDCTSSCQIWSRIRHIETGAHSRYAATWVNFALGQVSNTRVFPVSRGVNTFDLRLRRSGPSGTLRASYAELTALYVPFGSTGASTP